MLKKKRREIGSCGIAMECLKEEESGESAM